MAKRKAKTEERSLENPASPLNGWEFLAGSPASSGVRVNLQSALSYSPVFRAIDLVSSDIARCHCHVLKRKGQGKERDTTHPAYKLVRRKPNPYQTSRDWLKTTVAHALFLGNSYSWIERNADGSPASLNMLDTECTYPERVGSTVFYVTQVNGQEVRLSADSVLHIKGLSWDGLQGIGVLDKARETIGLGIAARTFTSKFFKNNARPGLAIEVPGGADKALANMRESWERQQGGLDNAHRIALLTGGAKLTTYGFNLQEADMSALLKLNTREIANFFGIPAFKLGDDSRTAFASLEIESLSYLSSLEPWFGAIEEECFDKLLSEEEKDNETHLIEFTREELIRVDVKTQHEVWAIGSQYGWYNQDEIRSFLNLPEIPDGNGKHHWVQSNMQRIDAAPQEQQEQQKRMLLPTYIALRDALRRCYTRLNLHAKRAAEKPERFLSFLDSVETEHRGTLIEILNPAVTLANALGSKTTTADLVSELVTNYRKDLLEQSECRSEDLAVRVSAYLDALEQTRPELLTKEVMR